MSDKDTQLREWVELEKAFRQATDRLVESLQAENTRLTSEVARLRGELDLLRRPTQTPREFYCRHMAAYVYSCTACDDERRAIDAALAKP